MRRRGGRRGETNRGSARGAIRSDQLDTNDNENGDDKPLRPKNRAINLPEAIDRATKNDPSLSEISLAMIDAAGASKLASALVGNTFVKELNLNLSFVGDEVAAHLGNMLRNNTSLRMVDLHDNKIGDSGAASLASALKENTSLHTLWLSRNHIGDDGASLLASAMEANTTLIELKLRRNNIRDQSPEQKIYSIVKRNKKIKMINVISNRLQDDFDVRSPKGLVDAIVDMNKEEDVFENVLFNVFRKVPVDYDARSAKGLVDATVDMNKEEDVFENVLFNVFRKVPDVMDRCFFRQ